LAVHCKSSSEIGDGTFLELSRKDAMNSKILVLDLPPGDEEILEKLSPALHAIHEDTEKLFDYEETVERGDLVKHLYIDLSSDDRILIIDDFQTPVAYVQIESHEHLAYLTEQLSRWLSPLSFTELEERAWQARGQDPGALLRMALAADDHPSERACALMREALASQDKRVRNVGIEAAGLTSWTVLGPDLEAIAQHDPDPEVRAYAAMARQLLDTARSGGPGKE
jgi:hypothetical protein